MFLRFRLYSFIRKNSFCVILTLRDMGINLEDKGETFEKYHSVAQA
jgi:hypothetical protein